MTGKFYRIRVLDMKEREREREEIDKNRWESLWLGGIIVIKIPCACDCQNPLSSGGKKIGSTMGTGCDMRKEGWEKVEC